jgi:dTDP-4-dehydrorhamnose 3,5-epimerase
MIHGVVLKELVTHPDDRGFFRELIRVTDGFFAEGFAQWSHSRMAKNVVKAWHFHHRQVDWWYVPIGTIDVALYDLREDSPTRGDKMTFRMGSEHPLVTRIPPGVAHGCKVVSDEAHLFYITSATYDPDDEGRYPFDTDTIPHDWGDPATVITSERDRRFHVPPYPAPRAAAGERD